MDKLNLEDALNFGELSGRSREYSALSLAYIGDCVYEIYVRSYLLGKGNRRVNDLHRMATQYVRAKAQAEFYHKIEDILTENEKAVFHRGRNTKSHPPKNADVIEYKIATGVEALIGYLYIEGKSDRISELMSNLFV